MSSIDLRFRQVHLDFHTSEHIRGIGADFRPDEFADTLAEAAVDSVTCFARCHHGWLYYPSRAFPQHVHPHLERKNLLGEQIEACHKRDIRVPIYITVQWDQLSAEQHPEWICRAEDGSPITEAQSDQSHYNAYAPGFYRFLCVNTAYRDYLKAVTREVMQTLPTDGLFYDIVKPVACSCSACRAAMAKRGLDASCFEVRRQFGLEVISDFMHDMSAFVRGINPQATIFYNSSHVSPGHRPWLDAFTHLELESLPSGGWGYAHFPLTARYARTLGLDIMGMTGKFHTSWGDFHSFKNPAALEFECFHSLALNARCSVGDQLHPGGKICKHTYELIGNVYRQVEAKEPFCRGATALTDVAVLTGEDFASGTFKDLQPWLLGAVRMLQELGYPFDLIDEHADFRDYRMVILPDQIGLSPATAERLEAYVADGGLVIASYHSALAMDNGQEPLEAMGVRPVGEAPYSPDFLIPRSALAHDLPRTAHAMYLRGMEVSAGPGAKVAADVAVPYFNRTWEHFCSHRHTPSSGEVGYPAAVMTGRTIYFAHPIFTQYAENAPRWCKQLLSNAINRLMPDPLIRHDGPSTLIVTLNEQPEHKRWVLHLLHYIPERRGRAFDVVEDVIPLHDLHVSVAADKPLRSARLVPQDEPLEMTIADGRLEITVPRVHGHQMIELSYGG